MKTKLVIEGAYGERNFGDDALLKVLYKKLENPVLDIEVACKEEPEEYPLSELCSDAPVKQRDEIDWNKVDHVVFGGGTQFFSFEKSSSFMFKVSLVLKKPSLILSKIKSIFNREANKAKKHYIGVGIGPFKGSKKFSDYKEGFEKAETMFVRDQVSYNYVKGLNINNIQLYTDLCFSHRIERTKKARESIKKVGVILRDWKHNENKFDINIIDYELSEYDVTYIVLGNDKDLLKELKKKRVSYLEYNPGLVSFEDFLAELEDFDVFLTSRYHGIIYGMLLSIPSIVLAIEPKLEIASKELYSLALLKSDEIHLIESILKSTKLQEVRTEIQKIVKEKRDKSDKMLENINSILLS